MWLAEVSNPEETSLEQAERSPANPAISLGLQAKSGQAKLKRFPIPSTPHNFLRRVRVKLVLPLSIVSDTLHIAMLLHRFLADDGSVLKPEQRVRGKANHLDAWRFRPRTRSPAPSPVRLWSGTEPPPARLDPAWSGHCRSEMSLTLPLVLVNKPDMLTSPNSVFSIFPILREAPPPVVVFV
ncbi:hypothetical protein CSIM01_06930 [Colletotrichum simmondsii]|uniref:Uncharacterized protein n=1 Tax=Colletotrichum simmondsii TaxID=703756 RepID=A0A135SXN5_9PEZI|nr:hypothetical protein CSIM01_06930 [Colletotrichum simmondsii]